MRRAMLQKIGGGALPFNTRIGGIAGTINTAALLAAKTTLLEAQITNFEVVGSDVKCLITANYNTVANAFLNNTDITYFVDLDNHLRSISNSTFHNASNFKILKADLSFSSGATQTIRASGLVSLTHNTTLINNNFTLGYATSCKYMRLSSATSGNSIGGLRELTSILRLYIPNMTTFSANDWNNGNELLWLLKTGCKIYVNASYDGGTLPHALDYAQTSRSATLIYVNNTTAPSAITDLSVSDINNNDVVLNFTPPASTNSLDFYEVWLERQDLDEWHLDRVIGRYSIYSEITASGQMITGLITGTTYKVKLIACDEFWNRSADSNEVTFSTLGELWDDSDIWDDSEDWLE